MWKFSSAVFSFEISWFTSQWLCVFSSANSNITFASPLKLVDSNLSIASCVFGDSTSNSSAKIESFNVFLKHTTVTNPQSLIYPHFNKFLLVDSELLSILSIYPRSISWNSRSNSITIFTYNLPHISSLPDLTALQCLFKLFRRSIYSSAVFVAENTWICTLDILSDFNGLIFTIYFYFIL